jgi:putative oxidoreductase
MFRASKLVEWNTALARLLDRLQPLGQLAARVYLADIFMRSGWLKLTSWQSTVALFESEYRVPLLPPTVAAVAGTFGELFFPALLLVGLFGRIGAIGTFVVNAVAVIAYAHVLLADGLEAAFGQHVLWGVIAFGLVLFGPGLISVDAWLERRSALSAQEAS